MLKDAIYNVESCDLQCWKLRFAMLKVAIYNVESCDLQCWKLRFVMLKLTICNVESCDLQCWNSRFAMLKVAICNVESWNPSAYQDRQKVSSVAITSSHLLPRANAMCHMSSVLVVASFASVEELYRSAKDLLRVASKRERMESPQRMTCELFMTISMHYLNINIL